MVTCGHQFHMGDECDWLISSSAVCPINGNSSATKILKKLIEAHCKTRTEESQEVFTEVSGKKNDVNKLELSSRSQWAEFFTEALQESHPKKMPEFILEAREIPLAMPHRKATKGTENGYYLPVYCDSEDFDEDQHLDGCPIKWYYRKRTKNGWGPCVALRRSTEENHKCVENKSGKKFRDRIPLEVKIGKISLNKREPFSDFRNLGATKKENERDYKRFEIDPKVAEMQKKRLEAKLNWRPFQEDDDDHDSSELSLERSSRDGYLRPRSALGGKSPVSILLFPYHQQKNCSCGRVTSKEVPKVRDRASSACHNKKTSNISDISRSTKVFRPKTTQALRWGSKPQRKGKRLQLPKQMNVFFDAPKNRLSISSNSIVGLKKQGERIAVINKKNNEERIRNSQSLTSLYYELEDKSNSGKVIDDEYLERMIRELSMEDNIRGIRNILNPGFSVKKKRYKRESSSIGCQSDDRKTDDRFKVICRQVKFSQRNPKTQTLSVKGLVPR